MYAGVDDDALVLVVDVEREVAVAGYSTDEYSGDDVGGP